LSKDLIGKLALSSRLIPSSGWLDTRTTAGGNIEPPRLQVEHGGSASFTLSPDTGYHIDSVTGCNGTLSGDSYTTGTISGACTVNATFSRNSYMLSATAEPGGNISPASVEIQHGESTTFTLTPDTGYHIDSVTGCGGTLSGDSYTTGLISGACTVSATFRLNRYSLSSTAGLGGSILPTRVEILHGDNATFTLTPDTGYHIDNVTGCGGTLSGNSYTTGSISGACSVDATFLLNRYPLSATAGPGGSISPASVEVQHGESTTFTLTPDTGYRIDSVAGCGGTLSGNGYTTEPISAACSVNATFIRNPPAVAATLSLTPTPTKLFRFTWNDVGDATFYRLLENPDGNSGFSQPGSDIPAGIQTVDQVVPLYARLNARYLLQSCNEGGCSDSAVVTVSGTLTSAVGYFKASNNSSSIWFGGAIAVSRDGNTLAVGAPGEDSNATGIDGNQGDNSAADSGAVYLFTRNGSSWSQQAYVKASNAEAGDAFGRHVALSGDGSTLAVSAPWETSAAVGIDGNQGDNSVTTAGAVYIFTRNGGSWAQQAYLKSDTAVAGDWFGRSVSLDSSGDTLAVSKVLSTFGGRAYIFARSSGNWSQQASLVGTNTTNGDQFGRSLSLSSDGTTLAVGAINEDGGIAGINGDGSDNSLTNSGATYVFTRSGGGWQQQAYIKASNPDPSDGFGQAVILSGDGNTLAVGAPFEDSSATGINGNENDNSVSNAGAAYLFVRNGGSWSQQAYIKASNTKDIEDRFGGAVGLGNGTLAVGAPLEQGGASGINNTSATTNYDSGAVYLY